MTTSSHDRRTLRHSHTVLRAVQISDTHLSRWDGPLRRNFRALAAFVNEILRPDLVVHAGDMVLANPDAEEDFLEAKALLRLIDAPIRFIPGNHDVGEPYERSWWTTTAPRLERYERHFGPPQWVEWLGEVALVGINSQIFGTGIPHEAAQWRWLEDVAPTLEGRPVLLFQHKSFWSPYCGSDGRQGAIDPADRERILDVLRDSRLVGVSNGDVHRFRKTWHGDRFEVWGPSTGFLVHREEAEKLPGGLEQLGVVQFDVIGDHVKPTFQTVPGLEEVEVGGFREGPLIRDEIAAAMRSPVCPP